LDRSHLAQELSSKPLCRRKNRRKDEVTERRGRRLKRLLNDLKMPDCFTLDAGLLARSQYPEEPATGHLDTGFSWFPCVYKRMLRWFPSFQVASTCLSCSPPDLNFLVTFFFLIFVYM